MKPKAFLDHLKYTLEERQTQYGDPALMFERVAKRWSLTLNTPVTAEQVALCMMDLKFTRLCRFPHHFDSISDVAGYAACLASLSNAPLAKPSVYIVSD